MFHEVISSSVLRVPHVYSSTNKVQVVYIVETKHKEAIPKSIRTFSETFNELVSDLLFGFSIV